MQLSVRILREFTVWSCYAFFLLLVHEKSGGAGKVFSYFYLFFDTSYEIPQRLRTVNVYRVIPWRQNANMHSAQLRYNQIYFA